MNRDRRHFLPLASLLVVAGCVSTSEHKVPVAVQPPPPAPAPAREISSVTESDPLSLSPVTLQDVCQYQESDSFRHQQTSDNCAKKLGHPVTRELYKEYPSTQPADLLALGQSVVAQFSSASQKGGYDHVPPNANPHDPNYDGRQHRVTHSKTHACMAGRLTVANNIPSALQVGVFKNAGATYRTLSRFANGLTFVNDDRDADARAHSFKIIGSEGEKLVPNSPHTQDFVMNNGQVFIFKSPQDFTSFFMKSIKLGDYASLLKKGYQLGFMATHQDERLALKKLTMRLPMNLLEDSYNTGVALRWGSYAVKAGLKHVKCADDDGRRSEMMATWESKIWNSGPDFYRQAFKQQLEVDRIPACWNFVVQVQTDPWSMPIEDTTLEWNEDVSVPYVLGQLRLDPQTIDNPEKLAICEGMSFNPWRTTADMRPLGDLAKLRGLTYSLSAKARRDANRASGKLGMPVNDAEPNGTEFDRF